MAFQKKESAASVSDDTPITLSFQQLQELLGGHAKGLTPEVLSEIMTKTAEMSAEAMRRSLKPENAHAPEISVFSYPEGERARPKPTLPFELFWMGFPVHRESSVVHWWEMEEYAKLKPGVYQCSLRDGGGTLKVTVTPETGPDGTVKKLTVMPDRVDRDVRPMIPSPYVWAYQMNHADRPPRETYVEAMSQLLTIALKDTQEKERRLQLVS